jgi:hypothetical protein
MGEKKKKEERKGKEMYGKMFFLCAKQIAQRIGRKI